MMKGTFALRLRNINLPLLAGLLLLASCSQDGEPAGEALPDGQYPLQIASVTLGVEGTEQPWTRITETADGSGSTWTGGEQIGVRIGTGTPGTYAVQADGTVSPVTPAYWQSTATTYVTAWYPTNETIDLSDQTGGLAYVLQAGVENAAYGQSVSLNFTHKLAKVRVVLDGTQAGQVTQVEVNNYTRCTNDRGTLISHGSDQGWIKMHQADATTWEANVIPGSAIDPANFIRLNGTAMTANLTGLPSTLGAGQMYTIDLTVGEPVIDLTADNRNITQDGNYRVRGSFPYNITISGNIAPTLYLENASISVNSGSAISITGGATPTIRVAGNSSIVPNYSSNRASGIYVETGSSVVISGNSKEGDVLRVTGATDGAAIGGYSTSYGQHTNCGDITISNVTVHAEACANYNNVYAPGIGSTGGTCGTITITDAIVHARSLGDSFYSGPAIGAYEGVPDVVIARSEVHAQRGSRGTSYADYIGRGGSQGGYTGGAIQCGAGSITDSTIYKETYNWGGGSTSSEGSVYYDASGTPAEQ